MNDPTRPDLLPCSRCKELKSLSAFHLSRTTARGRAYMCKDCRIAWIQETKAERSVVSKQYNDQNLARRAAWRAANAEHIRKRNALYRKNNRAKVRAANKKWEQSNPERVQAKREADRARRANATIIQFSTVLWQEKRLAWGGCCWICGEVADEMDHVKPISRGGAHMLSNIRPICRRCNRSKGARWLGVQSIGELRRLVLATKD